MRALSHQRTAAQVLSACVTLAVCAACASSGGTKASSDRSSSDPGLGLATQACDLKAVRVPDGAALASQAAAASPRYATLNTYWSELASADVGVVSPADLAQAQSSEVQEKAAMALVISECHNLGIATPGIAP
jgi:hypothetical protein